MSSLRKSLRVAAIAILLSSRASAQTTEAAPSTDPAQIAADSSAQAEAEETQLLAAAPATQTDSAPLLSALAAEDVPAAPPRTPLPTRLGPFGITTNAGTLSFGLATQIRVTTLNDGGQFRDGGARDTDTSLEFRRVRLFFRGSFLDDKLTLNFQLSTAPSSLELLDASLDARVHRLVGLRFGQFKVPYTLHRFRSFANLPMTDWDLASIRFGSERQIGAEVHSIPTREAYLDYAFGVFAGPNARAAFERGVAETYAETLPNPSNLRTAQPPQEFHPEFIGRIGYASNDADPLNLSDPSGGGLRYYVGLSGAWDVRPRTTYDFNVRAAAEAMVKFEHVTFQAMTHLGFVDPINGGIELGMVGLALDLTYRPFQHFEIAARYSRVDTLQRFRRDARDYVDGLVAAADPADQASILAAHRSAGMSRHSEEYAIGANFPIIGRSLIVQTDFAILRNDRVGATNDTDSFRLRTQVQFAF